jgi:hypothetical protein
MLLETRVDQPKRRWRVRTQVWVVINALDPPFPVGFAGTERGVTAAHGEAIFGEAGGPLAVADTGVKGRVGNPLAGGGDEVVEAGLAFGSLVLSG